MSNSDQYINIRGLFCEALIDQDRYIGEDPVGHCCCNKATRKYERNDQSVYVCDQCYEMIDTEPERVTLQFMPNAYKILIDMVHK
jgi:hypothetical protein